MGWDSSDRRAHLPDDWSTIRSRVLARDAYTCQIAGPRCTGRATEVDHMGHRDDHRPEVLRAVCHSCHSIRSAMQGVESSSEMRARRLRPQERHPGLIQP